MSPLNELDLRIQRVTASMDRSRYAAYGSFALLISQLAIRAAAPEPDPYGSDADQFADSLTSGIADVLTAPLLYAAIALLLTFTAAGLVNRGRRIKLLAERRQLLGQPPLPPEEPPQMPDRPWR